MQNVSLIRYFTIALFLFWQSYWVVTEYQANKRKPGNIKPTLMSRCERYVTDLMVLILLLQLLGLPIFVFHASVILQEIGLLCSIIGIWMSIAARRALGANWSHAAEFQIKSQHALITSGVYTFIRHPIYFGMFLAYIGAEIVSQSYLFLFGIIVFLLFGTFIAKREEKVLLKYFGDSYLQYRKRSKMFIPFLY